MTERFPGDASKTPRSIDATSSADGAASNPESKLFVVDRREGKLVVLVDDEGNTTEVEAARLPARCRAEGAVLRVPLSGGSVPVWTGAVRDRTEEKRRLADLAERVEKLRRTDPGGDVSL